MKTLYLKLTLKEPLVISQTNATSGAHQSMDYLPGATLLGAFASKFYAEYKSMGIAEGIFHSGRVRFQNAYPLIDGSQSLPIPFSMHYDKLGDKHAPLNYLQKKFTQGEQGKQRRKGFISSSKNCASNFWEHQPQKTLQMRTAIHKKQGVAQEGQLFGYQMLKAGEQFLTRIDVDDDNYFAAIHQSANQLNEIFIGRSRSAQYGRIKVEVVNLPKKDSMSPVMELDIKGQKEKCLVLWLASDMAVSNQYGQPTLVPTLKDLGLKTKGKFIPSNSFVRTRKYSPYNGFRRSYDLERQVLVQGSVLAYQIEDDFNDTDLATMEAGLGLYTESGLGQIVLNDMKEILAQDEISLCKFELENNTVKVATPTTDLIKYLKLQADKQSGADEQARYIEERLAELYKLYQSARNYNGIQAGQPFGPTKSQWGAIRQMATDATEIGDFHDMLFNEKQGFIRKGDLSWDISTGESHFIAWFKDSISNQDLDTVRHLAFKVTQSTRLLNVMEGKA